MTGPFGAMATVDALAISGIVDDTGTLYLAGVADDVQLSVKWGNSQDQQCTAHITLNSEHHAVSPTGIHYLSATCQQEPQNVK